MATSKSAKRLSKLDDQGFQARAEAILAGNPTESQVYEIWQSLQEREDLKYSDVWFAAQDRVSKLVEED